MNRPPGSPPPTGRPRSPDSEISLIIAGVQESMGRALPKVVAALMRIALNPKVAARERISALDKLMKHTVGNPVGRMEHTGEVSHVFMAWEPSVEKLKQLAKEYQGEIVDGEVVDDD